MNRRRFGFLVAVVFVLGLGITLLVPKLTRAQGESILTRAAVDGDLGTVFTYQGYLEDGGEPAEGNYNFRFYLWDDNSKTTLLATYPTDSALSVPVSEGLFTVELYFDDQVFFGQERWLEIEVNGVFMTPLQQLTAAPYALSLQPGAVISGTVPLPAGILNLSNDAGNGLRVDRASEHGVYVSFAGSDGVHVYQASNDGLQVSYAGEDGVSVAIASEDGVQVGSAGADGLKVKSADGDGVHVSSSANDGVDVYLAGGDGLKICRTGAETSCDRQDSLNNGVEIGSTEHHGIYIDDAGSEGLRVNTAGDDGVRVDYAGDHGFDVYSAGSDGLHVTSANISGVFVGSVAEDGLKVCRTGSKESCDNQPDLHNGVEIGSTEHHGVYVDEADGSALYVDTAFGHGMYVSWTGNDGVHVDSAFDDGIYIGSANGDFIQAGSNTNPKFKVLSTGEVLSDVGFDTPARDFAEMMTLAGDPTEFEPGDVLVISVEQDQGVALSSEAFAKTVIGVYSTAPGFVGGQPVDDSELSGMAPVALLGIVPTKVSAENGPIQRGDLLVTSATPGHAMRADDPPPGTVLGKALEALESGTGVILVLVTLQ
jgi:hypothetical protein